MSFRRGYLALIAVPVLAIGLAACGGSSNSSSGSSNASASVPAQTSSGSGTVSTKSVSGVGTVLVDSKGMTLYTNDQDTPSKIACTGQCQSFWIPLKASGGNPTSSDSSVQAKLSVEQGIVTFDGKPLYTFVQDTSPGQATGNGFQDSFGGTNFTWTAATVSGAAPASSSSTSGGSSSSGGMGSSSSSSGGYSSGY
jgi:predicted lipoprotein with Yx(FWY)xxD motif